MVYHNKSNREKLQQWLDLVSFQPLDMASFLNEIAHSDEFANYTTDWLMASDDIKIEEPQANSNVRVSLILNCLTA